jgi:hypothetical protein
MHEAMALYHLSQENFRGAAAEFLQIAALDSDKAEAWTTLTRIPGSGADSYSARLYHESAWGHRFLATYSSGATSKMLRRSTEGPRHRTSAIRLHTLLAKPICMPKLKNQRPNFASTFSLTREMSYGSAWQNCSWPRPSF